MKLKSYISTLMLALLSLTVNAQESPAVELICPEHVIVYCKSELKPFEEYGNAMYQFGDESGQIEDFETIDNIDHCEKGFVERVWKYAIENGEESKCSQKIFIGQDEESRPLIKWPTKEVIVSWCTPSYSPNDLPLDARRPQYNEGECNKMEYSYSDEIVYLSKSCKEVKRSWLVYDWCYDSKSLPGNDGRYKFTQIIKFAVPEDISYVAPEDVYATAEDCDKVEIKMNDVTADLEGCGRRVKITNDSPFANNSGKNATGKYPVGETIITYSVELACTDTRTFTQRVIVSDPCKEQALNEKKELNRKLQRSFVRPNPFSQNAELFFHNLNDSGAQLKIQNSKGKLLVDKNYVINKSGNQSIAIPASELPTAGVYLYTLTVGDRVLEGKLIKIN